MKYLYPFLVPSVLRYQSRGINSLRKEYGYKPYSTYFEGFTDGDWTVYSDLEEIVPCRNLSPNHHYIGPIIWSPQCTLPRWWDDLNREKPLIYLCLGSSGESSLLTAIARGIQSSGYNLVISTAGKEILFDSHRQIFTAKYLPGSDIVRFADLVICNGGSPAVYQALQGGVPVIGVPVNMDQLLMMHYVSRAGVGITVRGDEVTSERIEAAFRAIVDQSEYKSNAQRIQRSIEQSRPLERFRRIIEGIFERGGAHGRVENL